MEFCFFMTAVLEKINAEILSEPQKIVLETEENYRTQINRIAKTIADNDDIKIVFLAGPSGSGKTTSAHLLRERLACLGEKTAVLSLDDFYLPEDELPILADGSIDYESVNTLDLPLLRKCFEEIIASGKTVLPRFDFATKVRDVSAIPIDVGSIGIVIVEGLHALNPLIVSLVERKNTFKVYVSVNDGIVDESGNTVLTSHQIRLARRMLRDEKFRSASPELTLHFWENVVVEEKKHLYAYKKTADICLVTLHSYEPCLYRNHIEKAMKQVHSDVPCYDFFMDMATNILRFCALSDKFVPNDSLLREFIGSN